MKPRTNRRKAAERLQVTRLERLPATSFGKLVTRALGGGPSLGGVSILHERLPARTSGSAISIFHPALAVGPDADISVGS